MDKKDNDANNDVTMVFSSDWTPSLFDLEANQ